MLRYVLYQIGIRCLPATHAQKRMEQILLYQVEIKLAIVIAHATIAGGFYCQGKILYEILKNLIIICYNEFKICGFLWENVKMAKKQSKTTLAVDAAERKKKRRAAYIIGAVAAVCAIAVVVKHVLTSGPFMYAGTLETTKVIISARVASDIADIPVAEGDNVTQGQVLMNLSCDTYKILATQIDNDFARAEALSQRGHISQAEFDVLNRNKRDNDLKLQWCQITSPMDGVVVTRFREPGEVVAPGTALLTVANPYEIWAYFYVPYTMLHQLRVGQVVKGVLPEAGGATFPGRIVKISEQAEFTPKNVQTREERTRLVYGVKVRFENDDLVLKSGMTIESDLQAE